MVITNTRKKLQDELRQNFGWRSNTNYNHGMILEKQNESTQTDICMNLDDRQIRREILEGDGSSVEISLHKYAMNKDGTYTELESLTNHISLAELELIYKIAKEKELEIYCDMFKTSLLEGRKEGANYERKR